MRRLRDLDLQGVGLMSILQLRNMSSLPAALFLIVSGGALAVAQSTPPRATPDNTAVNKRDRNSSQVTADQQKENAGDRDLTARIRRSIVDDKSLSTYAHNVKIVARNGVVTLKGPVRSETEVNSIVAKATEAAGGGDRVVNQLSVKPKS
jgi:hyperosmotically inducible protein